MFNAEQLRVFLDALINLNLYFAEDVAADIIGDDENNRLTAEEVLVNHRRRTSRRQAHRLCRPSRLYHPYRSNSTRGRDRLSCRSRSRLRSSATQESQQTEEGGDDPRQSLAQKERAKKSVAA